MPDQKTTTSGAEGKAARLAGPQEYRNRIGNLICVTSDVEMMARIVHSLAEDLDAQGRRIAVGDGSGHLVTNESTELLSWAALHLMHMAVDATKTTLDAEDNRSRAA